MERRRSLPRTNTAAAAAAAAAKVTSPLSDHNTSPLRRKSISFSSPFNNNPAADSPNSPLHRPSNTPSSSSSSPSLPNRKSTPDSPRRLHKQRSSDDLQTRLLWPSSKKLNPSADADAAATYNVSTFSSRQRVSDDQKGDSGRRSLRHHIGKFHVERSLKKPGTPPSPSSSSRFSFNEAALGGRKRSDFGVDFPSTESEQSEGISRVVRRQESPAKGKNGGVGSFISQGLNNLFRRKSFQGSGGESVKKPVVTAGFGSPVRERGAMVKGMGSPGRETMVTARGYGSPAAVVDGEMQYKLRMLHNYLIQWRFVNAGMAVVDKIKCGNAERTLVNAWLGLSDLRTLVTKKRVQVEKEKLKFKLNTLVCHQTKALEKWGTMERDHLAALSSTKDSLQAAVCRLPITDQAKVDPHLLSISLRQATNIATAINGNIAKCHSRAQNTGPLVAELSQVVAREKLLLEECIELLGLVSTLQVHEESLRSNIIQLKSQHLTRCAAKGPSC